MHDVKHLLGQWLLPDDGTEHLFFGVQRQAETTDQDLDDLLGASAVEIHRRLTEMLGRSGSGLAMRSPALQAALDWARSHAGQAPMTTGHLLSGMLADPASQAARALAEMRVDPQRVQATLDDVNLADTSDASPAPPAIAITIGESTTVIVDPDLASALQQLTADQLRDIIRKAIDHPDTGQGAGCHPGGLSGTPLVGQVRSAVQTRRPARPRSTRHRRSRRPARR